MDLNCLRFILTREEKQQFDEEGYFIVSGAIPKKNVAALITAANKIDSNLQPNISVDQFKVKIYYDIIGKHDSFLELLDWPRTFPKVWGLLGWHIQLYHSQLIFTSHVDSQNSSIPQRLDWHQDSGRLNQDLEGDPRPRISLKVAYFLTDCSTSDCGNFHIIPGSHRSNKIIFPEDKYHDPAGAKPIIVSPGDAVFFDRRLWHAAGYNFSNHDRKVIFFGYSYRWLRPRDNMTVGHYLEKCDPIRRQLLGESPSGGMGYTSPNNEDVPLRAWISKNLGEDAVIP